MIDAFSSTAPALSASLPDQYLRQFMDEDPMVWSEKYSIGIGVIDTPHEELFDAINDLYLAVFGEEDREVVSSLLTRLVEAAHAQFTAKKL